MVLLIKKRVVLREREIWKCQRFRISANYQKSPRQKAQQTKEMVAEKCAKNVESMCNECIYVSG